MEEAPKRQPIPRRSEPSSPWEKAFEFPVLTSITILAIICFFQTQRLAPADQNYFIARFFAHPILVWEGFGLGIWRLVTTAFFHADVLHIGFNLYLLWILGQPLERQLGPWKTTGLMLLLAVVSSAAQVMACSPGIGLSGVGYGIFGVLVVGRHYRTDMAYACHERLVHALIFWFFLCILLTIAKILPIANFAHGGGLACGWLFGKALYELDRRTLWTAALAGLSVVTLVLSYVVPMVIVGPSNL